MTRPLLVKLRIYVLFLVLNIAFFIPVNLLAQDNLPKNEAEKPSQLTQFFNSLKYSTTHAFNPATFETWKMVAGSVFLVACLTGIDFELKEEYVFEKHYPPLNIPKYLSKIGKIYDSPDPFYFTVVTVGAAYGSGLYFGDEKLRQTGKLMLHSVIITGIYSTFLKALIGRARPYVGRSPHNFKPFNFNYNPDYVSMPSGHTSSIFALMSVLAGQYDSYIVKTLAYGFATTVAFQRVDNNKHWVSDVFLGAVLGYLTGSSLVEMEKTRTMSYSFKPLINEKGIGLAIEF